MMRLPWSFPKNHEYVELNNLDHRGSTVSQKYPDQQPWYRRWSLETWRPVVWSGVTTSAVVLIANLAVLFAGLADPEDDPTTRTLYKGSCSKASRTYTAWHLLINVLSTLLLGASNAASQILAAPTRTEVDAAHAKGHFVHIGVFDFLNLRFITRKRVILCALIAMSSIPLHLLYNSAIFNTTAIYDYYAIMVSPEFVNGGAYSMNATGTDYYSTASSYSFIEVLPGMNYSPSSNGLAAINNDIKELQQQAQNGSLLRLDNRDCILQFAVDIVSNYTAVLLVTKETANPSNQTLLGSLQYSLPKEMISSSPGDTAYAWVCDGGEYCDGSKQAQQSDQWVIRPNFPGVESPKEYGYTVDHCLVRLAPQNCQVDLSVNLMITVIVCNAIKLGCFLMCLSIKEHKPLVTVGDAVCSFLAHPDPTTVGLGPVSSRDVRHGAWTVHREAVVIAKQRLPDQNLVFPGQPWEDKRHRYYAAVGAGRWVATGLVSGIIFTTGFSLLLVGTVGQEWGVQAFSNKFNFTSRDVLDGSFSLFSAVFTANILQLAISNAYLLYNGVFTCVLLSAELADFATEAKTMRVTRPRASQRSTYWLQLPYRWSLPLMGIMTLLHWLVSEAIFMVDINVLGPNLKPLATDRDYGDPSFYGLAWGPTATLCAVVEGGLMIIFLFVNGFRKFPAGIPILSSNSAAISAACHASQAEHDDAVLRPLKYGVLETDSSREPKPTGFSARNVARLRGGESYGGTPDLDGDDAFAEEVDLRTPSPLSKGEETRALTTASETWGSAPQADGGQSRARSRPGRKVASLPKFV